MHCPPPQVYSLHKTSTRAYIARTAAAWGVGCRVVAELQFEIPKMYKHHRHASLDVAVDFWRFAPQGDGDDSGDEAPAASTLHGGLQGLCLNGGKGAAFGKGAAGKGGGKGGGGRGRGRGDEREGGAGGRSGGGGRGSKAGGPEGPRSKQEARAHAKARLEHYGGGGKVKAESSNKRGDGHRITKLG